MKDAVQKLTVGDGLNEETDIGPLIDQDAVDKVLSHIADAKEKGATVVTGGKNTDGLFMEPTVLTNVTDEMACMVEETFGPVAPIATFKEEEEAIERANDSIYGLAAYVFTKDINQAFRVTEALEYGIVGLNDGGPSAAQAPFGGFKQSGIVAKVVSKEWKSILKRSMCRLSCKTESLGLSLPRFFYFLLNYFLS